MRKLIQLAIGIVLVFLITACGVLPQVKAEDRLFLNLSLEFLGQYELPKQAFAGTPVSGLSGITYDRAKDRFYAISDDRAQSAPARFYTLKLVLDRTDENIPKLNTVEIESVTFLKNERGENYAPGTIDLEGIALSPRGTLFISSEGVTSQGIEPFIGEFDLKTGQWRQNLRIPRRYLPEDSADAAPRGIRDNLGFESLTLNATSVMKEDPFRLFVATESALAQDSATDTLADTGKIRLMHYGINPIGDPILVAEHLYLLDPPISDAISHGLSELTALPKEGYFLSLERTYGLLSFVVKIFQVVNTSATDTSSILSFRDSNQPLQPLQKKLLLNLDDLDLDLDNLEGMALGPRLPDGSQTLVLVSDDNFADEQVTQFLLFRLSEN